MIRARKWRYSIIGAGLPLTKTLDDDIEQPVNLALALVTIGVRHMWPADSGLVVSFARELSEIRFLFLGHVILQRGLRVAE